MKGETHISLYIVYQHFRRAAKIIEGISNRRTGDPNRSDAREIGQITKLYAHLKEGSSRLDKFFDGDDVRSTRDIPEDVIDTLYEFNGKIKTTMTYITEIFMMRLAIDDLPPGILRRYETYASDKENICHVENSVRGVCAILRQLLEIK